ncbi:unnamed protein product [Phytophthora lilii]|uniref:Unnamed protein product n=1 Tax=Phytophthora lilii TaxID=2077276 RepID=A0A9W6XT18_9STRA|nr:unnamed protein product [Phytophthora lilii]
MHRKQEQLVQAKELFNTYHFYISIGSDNRVHVLQRRQQAHFDMPFLEFHASVHLFCAIVGVAGSAFPVNIDENEAGGDLKEAIWKKIKDKFIHDDEFRSVVASDLKLFLAKTEGAWLDGAGAAAVALDERGHPQGCVQMDPTLWIKNPKHFGDNFQPGEGQVHVLVVVPKGVGDASAAPPAAMHRHPERLKRWAAINEMIRQKNRDGNAKTSIQDTNRKRKNRDIDSSVPYMLG